MTRDNRLALGIGTALAVLYALGINDVHKPRAYDGTVYLAGARGLVERGAYVNVDFTSAPHIGGFPPLTSVLIAPAAFFRHDVLVAKLILLLVTVAAWRALHVYFRDQMSPRAALLVPLAVALLPMGFVAGVSIASEWPFVLFAFLFLLWDRRARSAEGEARPVGAGQAALGAGLLVAATLTRWVGVCLFAAAAAQVLADAFTARSPRLLFTHRLTRVGLLAAVPVGAWALRTHVLTDAGVIQRHMLVPPSASCLFSPRSIVEAAARCADVFLSTDRVARLSPWAAGALYALAVPLALLVARGIWIRLRERNVLREGYVVATLALLMACCAREVRYILPIAPLLVFYFLTGTADLAPRAPTLTRLLRFALGAWMLVNLAAASAMIVRGNGVTQRGTFLDPFPQPRDYYLGDWRDVALAAEVLSERLAPGEPFATNAGTVKHLAALSRRTATLIPPSGEATPDAPARVLVWDTDGGGPESEAWTAAFPVVLWKGGTLVIRAR